MRVLVADDNQTIRSGIRSLLSRHVEWTVCAEAVDGIDAVEKAKEIQRAGGILLEVHVWSIRFQHHPEYAAQFPDPIPEVKNRRRFGARDPYQRAWLQRLHGDGTQPVAALQPGDWRHQLWHRVCPSCPSRPRSGIPTDNQPSVSILSEGFARTLAWLDLAFRQRPGCGQRSGLRYRPYSKL